MRAALRVVAGARERLAIDKDIRRAANDRTTASGGVALGRRRLAVDKDVGRALHDGPAVLRGVALTRRATAADRNVRASLSDRAAALGRRGLRIGRGESVPPQPLA
jgi:hypothetical protein